MSYPVRYKAQKNLLDATYPIREIYGRHYATNRSIARTISYSLLIATVAVILDSSITTAGFFGIVALCTLLIGYTWALGRAVGADKGIDREHYVQKIDPFTSYGSTTDKIHSSRTAWAIREAFRVRELHHLGKKHTRYAAALIPGFSDGHTHLYLCKWESGSQYPEVIETEKIYVGEDIDLEETEKVQQTLRVMRDRAHTLELEEYTDTFPERMSAHEEAERRRAAAFDRQKMITRMARDW